jgi:hypothetical protein
MLADNSFDYLVSQILNKRCVPVAGAGISLSSKAPDNENVHNVGWMVDTLKKELTKKRFARYDKSLHGNVCKWGCIEELAKLNLKIAEQDLCHSNCFFCDVFMAGKSNILGHLCELFLWEFDSLKYAYTSLVKLLKIPKYKDLLPTPAHIYIAKLAREGLLSEILTTNYDCNFEKAYNLVTSGKNTDVITSLDDYRSRGVQSDDLNRLQVYKINGCAKNLGDASEPEKCESILLTERQLQKWRNRRWAADLFRDRLRGNSLLFIGFGSDEPQVHHTLQTVLDEYTDGMINNGRKVLDTLNAPIVAIFDPQPSFHQQQIVKTYAQHHNQPAKQGDELIIRHPELNKNLSADLLWHFLYERIIRTKVIEALRSSAQSANASFTSIIPFSSTILTHALTSFKNGKKGDKNFVSAPPSWLENFFTAPTVLSNKAIVDKKNSNVFEMLVHCLSQLKGNTSNYYEPVINNQALISEFVLLIFLLKGYVSTDIEGDPERGLLLNVKSKNSIRKELYLNELPIKSTGMEERVNKVMGNTHLILKLGLARNNSTPNMERIKNVNNETGSIILETIITLNWKHIFTGKSYEGNMESVATTIKDAIESPTNYYFSNQPSIKNRTFLREIKA